MGRFFGESLVVFSCTIIVMIAVGLFATAQEAAHASAVEATHAWSARANPARLVNGAPVFFQVTPPQTLTSLSGTWLGHSIVFDAGSSQSSWFSLAGVSLESKPGRYPLHLEGETREGTKITYEQVFTVSAEKYPEVKLTVSKQYTAPSPEQLEIIKQDQEVKHKAFAETTPEREWSGKFDAPVDAPVSDVFGTRRVFNGATKSVHQGLDFRVPPSTPVSAINAGRVILARPLYFEGNCVVLDHGQGLLTLYLHLSELKVKEGDSVKRGQEIGLSGATGRATGPHLHLAVRWQGTYLDPAVLLKLSLPGS
jgi:murein DD-endopeptidase MepM/ murein hydrolase activator NlpD